MAAEIDYAKAFARVFAQDPNTSEEEAAYWFFDALRAGRLKERVEAGLGPMDEREAFKIAAACTREP